MTGTENGAARYMTMSSEKSRKVALILCLLGGIIGLHLFYVGRIGKGLLYAFTGGLFCIGVIMDTIAIATGSFKDNAGAALRQW
jgi:TM2 domain-containing membrane protein YozV